MLRKALDFPKSLHTFYYTWYGNLEVDGFWFHWETTVEETYAPPDSITVLFSIFSSGGGLWLLCLVLWLAEEEVVGVVVHAIHSFMPSISG
jgi:hypothetical protein